MNDVVADLEDDETVRVVRAWEVDEANRSAHVSDDGEWSRSSVQITQGRTEAKTLLKEHWKDMEQAIHDADMHLEDEGDVTVYIAGPLATDATFDLRLKDDLISRTWIWAFGGRCFAHRVWPLVAAASPLASES